MSKPSIGRIVLYRLNQADADAINRRRDHFDTVMPGKTGLQAHVGNDAEAGQMFPAQIVRVFGPGDNINLQVALDGNDSYWATSRGLGEYQEGCWMWPPRVG